MGTGVKPTACSVKSDDVIANDEVAVDCDAVGSIVVDGHAAPHSKLLLLSQYDFGGQFFTMLSTVCFSPFLFTS